MKPNSNPILEQILHQTITHTPHAIAAEVWIVQEPASRNNNTNNNKVKFQSQSYDARWHFPLLPNIWTGTQLLFSNANASSNNNKTWMNHTYHPSRSDSNSILNFKHSHSSRMILVASYLNRNALNHPPNNKNTIPNNNTSNANNNHTQQQQRQEAMLQLFEPHHPNYLAPTPSLGYPNLLLESRSFHSSTNTSMSEWLDVASILKDPLQMPLHRSKLISQAFGQVAVIPIRLQSSDGNKRGIVLFYAPHGSFRGGKIKNVKVDSFIRTSAVLISSAIAWSLERDAVRSCRSRREVELSVCHRMNGDGSKQKGLGVEESVLDAYFVLGYVTISMRQWWNKMKGGECLRSVLQRSFY